jgi:glycosyltransferase involved in cell wall biosynthesis
VGNRSRYKGFDTLLEAFSSWKQRDINLVCAGGGEWSEAEIQKISEYGLPGRITLFPQTSNEHLSELYNRASAFIYPSRYEGFGIPLLEAMACGCPIISSRIPSSVEVAQDVPFYFTSGNPEELTMALEQSLDKGECYLRRDAGLLLSHKYSWEKTASDFLQAIRPLR